VWRAFNGARQANGGLIRAGRGNLAAMTAEGKSDYIDIEKIAAGFVRHIAVHASGAKDKEEALEGWTAAGCPLRLAGSED